MKNVCVPIFERYIGIDYSGAETPTSSLRGLRVYMADQDGKLAQFFSPDLTLAERALAQVEGWIFGVM